MQKTGNTNGMTIPTASCECLVFFIAATARIIKRDLDVVYRIFCGKRPSGGSKMLKSHRAIISLSGWAGGEVH